MASALGKVAANAAKGAASSAKTSQSLRDIVLLAAANRQAAAPAPAPARIPMAPAVARILTGGGGAPDFVGQIQRSVPAPVQRLGGGGTTPPSMWNVPGYAPPLQGPPAPSSWVPTQPIIPGIDTGIYNIPGSLPWWNRPVTPMPNPTVMGPVVNFEDGSSTTDPLYPALPDPGFGTPPPSWPPLPPPAQMSAYPQEFVDYLYSLMFGRPRSL